MPSKFLVGKTYTTIGDNRAIYMGLVFADQNLYYPHIIQLFNGTDFTNKQELNITERIENCLLLENSLEGAIHRVKKELEYEKKLYNQIKNYVFYYSIANKYSKPNIISWVKAYATSYFLQVRYYLSQNPEDYSNERIELINDIISNTSKNNRLWRQIEGNSKLKI